jgi:hypothetical protein
VKPSEPPTGAIPDAKQKLCGCIAQPLRESRIAAIWLDLPDKPHAQNPGRHALGIQLPWTEFTARAKETKTIAKSKPADS